MCVHNPHGRGQLPLGASVRRFPLVEKHRALWIWLGEGGGDAATIPDFSILECAPETAAMRRDHIVMDAPWDLVTDNLMDLSHASFLHEGLLGNAEMVPDDTVVEQVGETVTVTRRSFGITPPSMFDMLFKADGRAIDNWVSMRWDAPSAMLLDTGITEPGGSRENGTGLFGIHLLTPETEQTTHYHFAAVRWNIRPGSETIEMKQRISDLRQYAFAEQDMPMLAAQSRVWHVSGPDYRRPVWLDIDVGVARWRKIVQNRLKVQPSRTRGGGVQTS
jgi:vanillate O-demethylase monooxygenase subunit